jgi:biopolymer transport protein ExbD
MALKRRLKIAGRRSIEEPEIIVIPMIDVMMFLLFFFMVASLAMVVQNAIPVQLPKASTGEDSNTPPLAITIKPDGELYLNTLPVTIDQIRPKLVGLHVTARNVVTVNSDERVPLGSVIAVMDEARKAGVTTFSFATNRK